MDFSQPKNLKLSYRLNAKFIFIAFLIFISTTLSTTNAATQGKLGKQSSASIEISVHVSQTLSTFSPNELLVNRTKSDETNFRPFCVLHHGYVLDSSVPYELKVEELTVPNKTNGTSQNNVGTLPYRVFLEEQNSQIKRQYLLPGASFNKQSKLIQSREGKQECINSGARLAIETVSRGNQDFDKEAISPGVLIMLISPK